MESTLTTMGEAFSLFRTELATIKAEQDNQKHQIISIEADWKTGLEGVNQSINRISLRMEERDKPRTTLWVSAFSAFFIVALALIGAAFSFVQVSISGQTTPLQQRIASMEQLTSNLHEIEDKTIRSREADARSEQDRTELNRRMTVMETSLAGQVAYSREQFAGLQAGFIETESQFKNITGQLFYMWSEVFGKPYPIIPREAPGIR